LPCPKRPVLTILANCYRTNACGAAWNCGSWDNPPRLLLKLRVYVYRCKTDPLNTYRLVHVLIEHRLFRLAIMATRQILDHAGMNDATTLEAPKFFNRIRFGNYYASLVIPASQEFNFHPLFVWSVIRQESLFDASARSSAGALGLMQIIPTTGQDIANRMGWPVGYTNPDLLRPMVSIRMGLHYLTSQLDYLNGDIYAALAGYNAGPGNAAVWQALAPGRQGSLPGNHSLFRTSALYQRHL
jgi:soluble lytic murein transglycosylase-like protein